MEKNELCDYIISIIKKINKEDIYVSNNTDIKNIKFDYL